MHRKGFTLIELLVVISIIGLMSSIILAGINQARMKARDSRRVQDLRQLSLAIEMYYDKYGVYQMGSGWCTQISHPTWTAGFQAAISEWLPKIPLDPIYANTHQDYFYYGRGTSYNLFAEFETSDRSDDGFSGCARINNIDNEYDYRVPSF